MKKLLFISVLALISCKKEDIKSNFLRSTVDFRASYVNDKYNSQYDCIKINVEGNESYVFDTYSNPCLHQSFGFNMTSTQDTTFLPYSITTERDTLESGMLMFTVNGSKLVKV